MEVHLTPQQEAFIEQSVREGHFASADEAVREAVDLLEQQARWLQEVRAAVDESDEDFANGRYTEYTDETTPQLLAELKQEARAVRDAKADITR